MVENGLFYSFCIDPLLQRIREKMKRYILKNEQVIDIACGTGEQVFAFAPKARWVVGVDLAESMIKWANKESLKRRIKNVEFVVANAEDLSRFSDKAFDVSTMSLALHQFPPEYYQPIISEMKRIAERIVIFDYAVPLQNTILGYGVRAIEFLAGREHNRCFKAYCAAGGLTAILSNNDLEITAMHTMGKGIFSVAECQTHVR